MDLKEERERQWWMFSGNWFHKDTELGTHEYHRVGRLYM